MMQGKQDKEKTEKLALWVGGFIAIAVILISIAVVIGTAWRVAF